MAVRTARPVGLGECQTRAATVAQAAQVVGLAPPELSLRVVAVAQAVERRTVPAVLEP